jgi:hypothetical protein
VLSPVFVDITILIKRENKFRAWPRIHKDTPTTHAL